MAHMMKKVDFLALVENVKEPRLKTFRGSVYLYDGEKYVDEIYRASNLKETGIMSAMNQSFKYKKWMDK